MQKDDIKSQIHMEVDWRMGFFELNGVPMHPNISNSALEAVITTVFPFTQIS